MLCQESETESVVKRKKKKEKKKRKKKHKKHKKDKKHKKHKKNNNVDSDSAGHLSDQVTVMLVYVAVKAAVNSHPGNNNCNCAFAELLCAFIMWSPTESI